MGHYEPETVSELASVTDDICKALQDNDGAPLNPEMKEALAKRVLELFENGITNADDLRIGTMTDSLWASSRGVTSLKEVPRPSAAASVAPVSYKWRRGPSKGPAIGRRSSPSEKEPRRLSLGSEVKQSRRMG